jgi:hypothetical protein
MMPRNRKSFNIDRTKLKLPRVFHHPNNDTYYTNSDGSIPLALCAHLRIFKKIGRHVMFKAKAPADEGKRTLLQAARRYGGDLTIGQLMAKLDTKLVKPTAEQLEAFKKADALLKEYLLNIADREERARLTRIEQECAAATRTLSKYGRAITKPSLLYLEWPRVVRELMLKLDYRTALIETRDDLSLGLVTVTVSYPGAKGKPSYQYLLNRLNMHLKGITSAIFVEYAERGGEVVALKLVFNSRDVDTMHKDFTAVTKVGATP